MAKPFCVKIICEVTISYIIFEVCLWDIFLYKFLMIYFLSDVCLKYYRYDFKLFQKNLIIFNFQILRINYYYYNLLILNILWHQGKIYVCVLANEKQLLIFFKYHDTFEFEKTHTLVAKISKFARSSAVIFLFDVIKTNYHNNEINRTFFFTLSTKVMQ